MPVISALDEKTELDKVVELPSVETIGYTHDWIHPWQSEWLHYSMCNMMGESLAKKNYRESTSYCRPILQLAKILGNYRKARLNVLRVQKECMQMHVHVNRHIHGTFYRYCFYQNSPNNTLIN